MTTIEPQLDYEIGDVFQIIERHGAPDGWGHLCWRQKSRRGESKDSLRMSNLMSPKATLVLGCLGTKLSLLVKPRLFRLM